MEPALAAGCDLRQRSLTEAGHLVLDRLSRSFGGTRVVDDVSLSVARGCFVALLGPSGCGKTTTLRMVAGLDAPESGRVMVGGADVTGLPAYRRNMGVVFQSYALFPHMSAATNVAFGLEMRGVGRAERNRRAAAALAMVGLPHSGAAKPRTLSGGQQQRVALARALAAEPDVLLLDEPLAALDAKLREELRSEIRAIQRQAGATALFVTHDQAEALAMADLVAVMHGGRIAQFGTPEDVFERPVSPFVAAFVGRSARFCGRVEGDGIRTGATLLRASGLTGSGTGGAGRGGAGRGGAGTVEVFVRPHRVRLLGAGETADNALEGRIAALAYAGEVMHVTVATAAGDVPVEMATNDGGWRALQLDQTVRAGWAAADTLWFAS